MEPGKPVMMRHGMGTPLKPNMRLVINGYWYYVRKETKKGYEIIPCPPEEVKKLNANMAERAKLLREKGVSKEGEEKALGYD